MDSCPLLLVYTLNSWCWPKALTDILFHIPFVGLSDLVFCLGFQSSVAICILLTHLPCLFVCSLFPMDSHVDWCADPRATISGVAIRMVLDGTPLNSKIWWSFYLKFVHICSRAWGDAVVWVTCDCEGLCVFMYILLDAFDVGLFSQISLATWRLWMMGGERSVVDFRAALTD